MKHNKVESVKERGRRSSGGCVLKCLVVVDDATRESVVIEAGGLSRASANRCDHCTLPRVRFYSSIS